MTQKNITLIGAPVDCGKARKGCMMGPDAYRTAGIVPALSDLGYTVRDIGNCIAEEVAPVSGAPSHLVSLEETIGWSRALRAVAEREAASGIPVFLGGDHALALGTVPGVAQYAASQGRPLFVLWLDAHTDFHTPETTASGNLHGTPVAYFTGQRGFTGFDPVEAPVPLDQVGMIGLRSVDAPEKDALGRSDCTLVDMRTIDERGIVKPLKKFLKRVAKENGMLHVSLDVDFLDPSVAPAVGTTVPGGATVREGHLVMELLHESGLVTSLDLVELNPALDDRSKTAALMVELTASLFGRKIFDRPTRSYQ